MNIKRLAILPFILLTIHLQGQQRPADARYTYLNNECNQLFAKPALLNIVRTDSVVAYQSISGSIVTDADFFGGPLFWENEKGRQIDSSFSADSAVAILFSSGILTNENLLQAARFNRLAVSQYGDTANFTLAVNNGDIRLYAIKVTPTPKYIRTPNSIAVNVGVVFTAEHFSIVHFDIIIQLPAGPPRENFYGKLRQGRLTCIRYIGFEI